jgi:hypothetical protein
VRRPNITTEEKVESLEDELARIVEIAIPTALLSFLC